MYSKEHCLDNEDLDICYVDDEGDIVVISNDTDLEHAVNMARHHGLDRLKLSMSADFVEDGHEEILSEARESTPTPAPREFIPAPAIPEPPKPKSSFGLSNELLYGLAGGFAVATVMGFVMSRMK
ncbi:hypothetical protein K7432_016752 [Basidiobolus ranarum]|uniref:PB1 domain-containing protein n=1 Tax=Basidiobolus ranarum TaxID=34480 RepID=A0ABR2VL81_9FUNG